MNKNIIDFKEYLSPFNDIITDYDKYYEINKILFLKEYHTDIIYSKSLYEIKRLMPSLFLFVLFLSHFQ